MFLLICCVSNAARHRSEHSVRQTDKGIWHWCCVRLYFAVYMVHTRTPVLLDEDERVGACVCQTLCLVCLCVSDIVYGVYASDIVFCVCACVRHCVWCVSDIVFGVCVRHCVWCVCVCQTLFLLVCVKHCVCVCQILCLRVSDIVFGLRAFVRHCVWFACVCQTLCLVFFVCVFDIVFGVCQTLCLMRVSDIVFGVCWMRGRQ